MSLPKNALYTNKVQTSYARNYQSQIQPQNGLNYSQGETLIINIPTSPNLLNQNNTSIILHYYTFRSSESIYALQVCVILFNLFKVTGVYISTQIILPHPLPSFPELYFSPKYSEN